MLNSKSFLAIDFGAGSLKLAEFAITEAGGLCLRYFDIRALGSEGTSDATREATILKALKETLAEGGLKARDINVCAPGFQVFSKFVKLPPVDANKVTQIIQYEAQQNVPFPLAEVVWDYQIMGSSSSGELEVLLVAIKSEIVEGLFRMAETVKLKLQLCDVSPAALCNAFKYNYGDLEDCTMLLDIGAKTSNVLFFEKGKVFSRSIPLGANAITQDFANESKLKFEIAEQIKIKEGFVSLGGAYEEPENPNQAAIAKIARQFMTRLHIQVNQTLQFYRGQQGGSAPQRLFLAGGAGIMPYTAQFFAEKLNVPVEYFNPFRNVQIDPAVNLEELARVAHSMAEVVGLGLRNLANCPVEMNLMPESTVRWRNFNEKKPYLMVAVFALVLVGFSVGFVFKQLAQVKYAALNNVEPKLQAAQALANRMQEAKRKTKDAQDQADQTAAWMQDRYYWGDVLLETRAALIRAENDVQKRLSKEKPDVQAGIWIEQMTSMGVAQNNPNQPGPGFNNQQGPAVGVTSTQAGVTVLLVCRAVSLQNVDASANGDIAYAVQNEMQACKCFDPKGTTLAGNISSDDPNGTFTFGVTVTLSHPPQF
ncbi:MAG: type IV pilus assembly protein PilM [Limisphaerales bacterium]